MKRYFFLVWCFFLLFSISIESLAQNKTWFVKVGGSGNGATWSTATGDLQTAINNANATDTILVSQGSYYGGFTMKEGVQVYGGFSGTEQYSTQSVPTKNITILDGSNLYRVLTQTTQFTTPTVWSGFVIQNGQINDLKPQSDINVGTIVYGKGTNKPAGVVFKYDKATGSGLMIALEQRSLEWGGNGVDIEKLENINDKNLALLDFNGAQNTIYITEQLGLNNDYAATWCQIYEGGGFTDWYLPACGELNIVISENFTILNNVLRTISGATLLTDRGYFTSTEKSSTNVWAQSIYGINDFSNVAQLGVIPIRAFNISDGDIATDKSGGGVLLLQNGILRNSILRNNQATLLGGGAYVGQGASLQGCWVTNNSAAKATGIYNWGTVLNCTVTNNLQNTNLGSFSIGGIVSEANSIVSNSIAFGNKDIANNIANIVPGGLISYTASNSIIAGVNNKIATSSDFVGAADFHLLINSALATAGNTFIIPSDYKTDLDGNPRIDNNTIALGAYQNLAQREVIITMNDSTVVYNGLPHALNLEVQPNTLIPVITYKSASGIETTTPPSKAGIYTVTALVAAQNPYPETVKTATLTIQKATPSLTLESKTAIYSGSPIGIDPVVAEGPIGAQDLVVTYRYTNTSGYDSNNEPVESGIYTVRASTVATDDFLSVTSAPVTLTIEKAVPEILATSKSSEYTGEPIPIDTPQITGSGTADQLPLIYSYKGINSTNYGPTSNPPTQSGSYEVTISTAGDTNHTQASATASLTIGKGVSTITLTGGEFTYDGSPKSLQAYVSPSSLSITYNYEGRLVDGTLYPTTSTPPINSGVYTVTASTPGDLSHLPAQVSARMVIHRKQSQINLANQSTQYTGQPISLSPGSTIPADAVVTITYKGQNSTNYPESPSAPVNVGEYQVRAVYNGDLNHFRTSKIAQLTITTGDAPTLILKNKTVVYNGNQQSIDPAIVEPSQAASEVLVRYFYTNPSYPMSTVAPVNAGIYTVRATTIATNNYESAHTTAYLTIDKAEQTITFDQAQLNGHYLGEAPFRLIATSDTSLPISFESGNPGIASISADGQVTIHKSGSVTITVHQAGDKNHYAAESVVRTLNIAAATPSLTLESKTAIYSGSPIGIDPVVAEGPIGAQDLVVTYRYTNTSGYDSNNEPVESGIYTVRASTVATDDFLSVTSAPVTLTIEKAVPEILATSKSSEYTGEPIPIDTPQITGSGTADQLPLIYSYKGINSTNYGPTSNPPTQSGSYEVTISTAGDTNHTQASATASLTIGKGVSTITLTGGEFTYDGSPKSLQAYVSPSSLSITYNYEGRLVDGTLYPTTSTPPINSGVYTVTASTPGDLSHLPAQVSARMVIHRKQSQINLANQSTQYTGQPISLSPGSTIPADAVVTITYKGQNSTNYPESPSAPVNVGEYQVRAVYNGDLNHFRTSKIAQLTITTGDAPTLILKNKTVVYNGNQQSIDPAIVEPSQAASEVLVRYFYTNPSYPMSTVAPVNAGIYTVRATTIATNNYESAHTTAYLTIDKAEQTITFDQAQLNGHYLGEAPFRLIATSDTSLPISFESGNPGIASISADGQVTIHKSGSVTITVHQAGDKNHYAAESVVRTLNIAAATPSLTLESKTAIYSGSPIGIDPVVAEGPIGAQDLVVTYRYTNTSGYDSNNEPVESGIYTVRASTVATDDFLSVTSAPVTLTIEKAVPEILATSKSSEYTGEPIPIDTPQITGSGTADQLPLIYSYKGINSTNYGPTSNPPTQSGSYEVTISTAGDTNHTQASATASLTIGKGVSTITLTGGEFTYDGSPKSLQAYVSPGSLSITYNYEGRLVDGTLYPTTSTPPINSGVYTVTASTPGDLSHLPAQVSARMVIHRKQSQINLANQSTQYTGQPISLSPGSTIPADAVVTITYKGQNSTNYPESPSAPVNVGEYQVRAVYNGDLNHFRTSKIAQLTITTGDAPTLILKNKTVVYNGNQQSIDPAIVEPSQAASEVLVRYFYTNPSYPMSTVAPVNAGIYTVRATTIATNNYESAHTTAYLTIDKAEQTITFDQAQLNGHYLGEAPFRLIATSDTSLPISFESGNPGIASISADGQVTIHKSGSVTITVHQAGDKNHYAAESVVRTLNIAAATPSLTLESKTAIYSGSPIGIDPVVAEGPIGAQDLVVTYRYTNTSGYDSNNEPVESGIYTVRASTVATDDFLSVTSAPVTLTIEKAVPEILATSKSSEYTGEPIPIDTPQITGSGTADQLPLIYSYKGINSTNYGPTSNPPTQSGSYEVTISTAGDTNHTQASATASLTIGKGVSTITLTGGEFTYDGSPKSLQAYVSPSSLSITYNYEGRLVDGTLYPTTSTPPINSGVYTVTASTPGDLSHLPAQVSARMVIHRKQSQINLANQSTQYTGQPISLSPGSTIPADAVVTITYKGQNSTNYPESPSAPVNVGEYQVRAVYNGDLNHFRTSKIAQLTITTGDAPTLILKNKTVVYNGNQQSIDPAIVEPSQAASEVLVRYFYTNPSYPMSTVAPVNAGIYTVRATTIATNNYESAHTTAYLTIDKAEQTITFDQAQLNGHYLGEAPFRLIATSDTSLPISFESGNPGIASISADGQVTIHKSGSVTITVHQAGDKNHYAAESVVRTLNIAAATPSLTLESKTAIYSGSPIGIDPVVAEGPIGAQDLVVTYRYTNTSGYDSNNEPVESGIYTVRASTVATDDFLSVTSAPVTLTIEKAVPEILATSKSSEYTGEPIPIDTPQITGSGTADQLPLIYSYKGINSTNYGPTSNPPTQSGSYEVTISTAGDTNHTQASATASLTIGKGVSTITLTGGEFTYDGSPKSLQAYVSPGSLSITYNYEGRLVDGTLYPTTSTPPINSGVYTVTASTPGDLSHLPAQVSARMVIHRKQSQINLANQSTQYTGQPISLSPGSTIPADAVVTITYKGQNSTNYPESPSAPVNVGEYQVRAVYNGDLNHFRTSKIAQLTITTGDAPTLILKNKTVVYNGNQQSIDPAIVEPSQAASEVLVRYFYTNPSYPMSTVAPVNAGIYTVRATTIATNNYESAHTTAYLTIDKAEQTITFDQAQLEGHSFGEAPFRLIATSDSNLPISFESGNPGIASVSADGQVTIHKSGSVTITAHQAGDKNYKPAESVTRTLNIISTDATLFGLTINGIEHNILEPYVVPCSYPYDKIDVVVITDPNATISIEKEFSVDVTKPMIKQIDFSITSQDSSQTRYYTLVVEKNFNFYDVVVQRWNNTLSVINNPANNGGYKFTDYKWYKNGVQVGSLIYYSVGEDDQLLNENDAYHLELTTSDGVVMRTCEGYPVLKSQGIKVYPNPLKIGDPLYLEVDFDEELLQKSELMVYDILGKYISKVKLEGRLTRVELPQKSGSYIIKLVSKDGFEKSLKVIVK